jgi:hypothetical protein
MIYKTLQISSDVKRVWCFLNEKLIKDLRICIFDWFGTTRILCTTEEILDPIFILCCYLVGNMVVKVSGTAVLHLTVNVFNNTFNKISVISRRSILLVEETAVSGEKHRPNTNH